MYIDLKIMPIQYLFVFTVLRPALFFVKSGNTVNDNLPNDGYLYYNIRNVTNVYYRLSYLK